MTLKKLKLSYKSILYKSKRLAMLALVLVFCTGLMVSGVLDENEDVPVHDGEVLVDSLAVSEDTSVKGDFDSMRAELDLSRNKLLASLDQTINNSSNENEKDNAAKEKQRIMSYMEKELAIESNIKSKNLPESFVIITEKSISITVDKQELDTNTVAKICDIAMRETGKNADSIIIQSKY